MSKRWDEIYRRVYQEAPAVEDFFLRKYPKAFFPSGSMETEPLALGIRTVLVVENPQIDWFVIAEVVARYVRKDRYQRALAIRPHRINLDGTVSGPVSQKNRDRAIGELISRQKARLEREAA